jgi:hypothetical protein
MEFIENKHSTTSNLPLPLRVPVSAFTLKVSHAPISLRLLVLRDPPVGLYKFAAAGAALLKPEAEAETWYGGGGGNGGDGCLGPAMHFVYPAARANAVYAAAAAAGLTRLDTRWVYNDTAAAAAAAPTLVGTGD